MQFSSLGIATYLQIYDVLLTRTHTGTTPSHISRPHELIIEQHRLCPTGLQVRVEYYEPHTPQSREHQAPDQRRPHVLLHLVGRVGVPRLVPKLHVVDEPQEREEKITRIVQRAGRLNLIRSRRSNHSPPWDARLRALRSVPGDPPPARRGQAAQPGFNFNPGIQSVVVSFFVLGALGQNLAPPPSLRDRKR